MSAEDPKLQGPAFRKSLLARLPKLEPQTSGGTGGPADLDVSSIIELEADAVIEPLAAIAPPASDLGWNQ